MKEIIIENAGFDNPRPTDYTWDQIFGSDNGEGPRIVKLPENLILRDQNANSNTRKGCGGYGMSHIMNAQNINEFKEEGLIYIQDNPRDFRYRFQKARGFPNIGSSLQAIMGHTKKEGLIEGYVVCQTEEQMKKAIDMGMYIFTGSNKIDRRKTGIAKKLVLGTSIGHIYFIGDYNNNGFNGGNSFGKIRGDNGYFNIPFGSKKHLYTTYAIIDKNSSKRIEKYKYDKEYIEAIRLGITNGTRPDEPATRKEVAVMVVRAIKNKSSIT